MLGSPKYHILFMGLLLLACLGLFLAVPGVMEAYATRFWDAALWVGGCFS